MQIVWDPLHLVHMNSYLLVEDKVGFLVLQVCTKALEPGNKNKRLNTSILIRYSMQSGRRNILIDAGK